MGAVFAPTRFSLVRISIRDLVAGGESSVRNSGVGGGGENLILKFGGTQSGHLRPLFCGHKEVLTLDVSNRVIRITDRAILNR